MGKLNTTVMALMMTLVCCMRMAAADPIVSSGGEPFLLAPPEEVRPIVVRAHFKFHDINEINDETETFDFSGVLTLKWHVIHAKPSTLLLRECMNECFRVATSLMSSRLAGIRR